MTVNAKEKKNNKKEDDINTIPVAEQIENGQAKPTGDPELSHLRELLLKAQKNAESAKATVNEVMTNIYNVNPPSKKNPEYLVRAPDDNTNSVMAEVDITNIVEDTDENDDKNHRAAVTTSDADNVKTGVLHKIMSNDSGPLNVFSGLIRSVFLNKSIEPGARREFYNLLTKQNKQLHQFIDNAIEKQAREKAEKIVERAKSEIAAAQIVVSQAQSEIDEARKQASSAREEARGAKVTAEEAMDAARKQINEAREEMIKIRADADEAIRVAQESLKRAREETRAEKEAAEVLVDQYKRETLSHMAEEIKVAKEEARTTREAAEKANKASAEELERSRTEVKNIQENAQAATALAQEKVKKAAQEIEEIKKQTQLAISQANEETKMAKEKSDIFLKNNQLIKDEAEKSIKFAEEARVQAEEKASSYFHAEITRLTEEIEKANKDALEIIAIARKEIQLARAETEAVKKASEEAVKAAQEEILTSKEEAVRSEQKALREIDALKEELRKTGEDTEAGLSERNELIAKDIHNYAAQTREELTGIKKTIDIAGPHPEVIQNRIVDINKSSSEHEEIDTRYITAMLDKMRAPLSSISGFARLMLEEDFPDNMTKQELLPNIIQKGDTLNILLDDLSSKLTAKSHQYGIIKKLVSPNKLINDVIQSMRSVALEKNILIGSAVLDTLPAVEADESRIKQVLNNLIDNALKYNEGDSTVIIKTQVLENELLILIEDHGIGIPDGELEVIFEEFHRASNHGDREGKGLGLGICKQIVESHDGRIRVQSVEGEGSLFGFTLPLINS